MRGEVGMGEPLEGAIELPDGSRVRGRGLRRGTPPGPVPAFGLYLGSPRLRRHHDAGLAWPHAWVRWPDFGVPSDPAAAVRAITDLHRRAHDGEPVEVACGGGVGRTGTVIACLAVLAGLGPADALGWAREHHHPRAVETPWQRRWIRRFADEAAHRPR